MIMIMIMMATMIMVLQISPCQSTLGRNPQHIEANAVKALSLPDGAGQLRTITRFTTTGCTDKIWINACLLITGSPSVSVFDPVPFLNLKY